MVRIGSNPSGSRPNFFGRQHLTFDKGVRMWCGARDSAGLGGLVRIGSNPHRHGSE